MSDRERADEAEWTLWFTLEADFGPADDDVRHWMAYRFQRKTGKAMPPGWEEYDEKEADDE